MDNYIVLKREVGKKDAFYHKLKALCIEHDIEIIVDTDLYGDQAEEFESRLGL